MQIDADEVIISVLIRVDLRASAANSESLQPVKNPAVHPIAKVTIPVYHHPTTPLPKETMA
jgi:hypothetical protein